MALERFDENSRSPCILFLGTTLSLPAASVYASRMDDPRAVYLTQSEFGAHADGKSDDTEEIQAAIDKVQEATGEGILFIPKGRYRITHTVYVWPGIRIIGYGQNRPVMVLAAGRNGAVVHVNIAETDVVRVRDAHRVRERLTNHVPGRPQCFRLTIGSMATSATR